MQKKTCFVQKTVLQPYSTVIGFAGREWWVIGYNGSGVYSQSGTATLLLKGDYGDSVFRMESNNFYEESKNEYAGSTLQSRMEEIASGFPGKEQALIIARTLTKVNDDISGPTVNNQKLWPLSGQEWNNIKNSEASKINGNNNYCW